MSRTYAKYYISYMGEDYIEVLDLEDFILETYHNGESFRSDFDDIDFSDFGCIDIECIEDLGHHFSEKEFKSLKHFIQENKDLFIIGKNSFKIIKTSVGIIELSGTTLVIKHTDKRKEIIKLQKTEEGLFLYKNGKKIKRLETVKPNIKYYLELDEEVLDYWVNIRLKIDDYLGTDIVIATINNSEIFIK